MPVTQKTYPEWVQQYLDIPAVGNHQSDAMETSCPEFGNRLDWVIVSRSEMTVLSSPQPHCGAKQALQYRNF